MPTSCSGYTNCVRFTWRDSANVFRYAEGAWNSSTISACFPGNTANPLDRVGIQMVAEHKTFTGLFGDSMTLSDHAVMNFEPLATQTCKAGDHS
jgi:hypothetical protein